MNLRKVDGRVAVDQHVHGVAYMRPINLRDVHPVRGAGGLRGGATKADGRLGGCIELQRRESPAWIFHRAHQRRVAHTRRMERRGQRGEIECVALRGAVVGDVGDGLRRRRFSSPPSCSMRRSEIPGRIERAGNATMNADETFRRDARFHVVSRLESAM